MTNERAYQRFLAVLNLARRPGTPEEGEAAMAMARKMAEKYGFDINDQSVADPVEQKKAHEVVRRWKQYQGDKKKDMMAVFKLARFAGYTVQADRILVSPNELSAISRAFSDYQKCKRRVRKEYRIRFGNSQGFSNEWDKCFKWYINYGMAYTHSILGNMTAEVFNQLVSALYNAKEG